MMTNVHERGAAGASHAPQDDVTLHARVLAEFREMPGMRLTLEQASRLFALERSRCARVLDRLVTAGALRMNGRQFLGCDIGRHSA